ncbi:hypothetical protein [Haloarchaeobius litoreus]|uniref:Lipoprotein n=1 Tax=Haloarchaeobius litoreus TaxID=755306 RepID=A0ABD6DJH8_9EURY|nr:hypothetical protein [Haloarchaeobius litoreus]
MQRRALLTALATGVASLTGCLKGSLDAAGGQSPDSPADIWGEEPPCPAFGRTADRTVCTGGGHPEPSGVTVALDPPVDAPLRAGKPFIVTLRPRADVPLTFAPGDWTVRRLGDEGWTDVASGKTPTGFTTVYPDEQYEWRVGVDGAVATTDEATRIGASFDPGRYAFSLTASVGRGWSHGKRIECVVLFAVRGR